MDFQLSSEEEAFRAEVVSFLDENLMTMNTSSGGTWLKEICRLLKENEQLINSTGVIDVGI